mmetsp:Transcript_20364/g.31879  ORF Transcript_20364/g.31879 Transcript_20364/m.31879 type:complete len:122 (+) Transcript_20364:3021-3386(+)
MREIAYAIWTGLLLVPLRFLLFEMSLGLDDSEFCSAKEDQSRRAQRNREISTMLRIVKIFWMEMICLSPLEVPRRLNVTIAQQSKIKRDYMGFKQGAGACRQGSTEDATCIAPQPELLCSV